MTDTNQFDVIIVGAGPCGTYAANYLYFNSNLKIALIESRERVGGRTFTSTVDGTPLGAYDLGGQWVGPGQHRVLNCISKYGITLLEQQYGIKEKLYTTTTNEHHLAVQTSNILELAYCKINSKDIKNECNAFLEQIEKLSKEIDITHIMTNTTNTTDTTSDGTGMPNTVTDTDKRSLAYEYDNISVSDYIDKTIIDSDARIECKVFMQSMLAEDPKLCSFLHFLIMLKSAGGIASLSDGDQGAQKWRLQGGMQQVSECLINEIIQDKQSNERFKTFFSTSVHSINHELGMPVIVTGTSIHTTDPTTTTATTTTTTTSTTTTTITSTSTTNTIVTISGKKCILALSPSVIKKNGLQFTPPLPHIKQCVIDTIIMGACIKVIIVYKRAFWTDLVTNNGHLKSLSVGELANECYIHNLFVSNVLTYPALVCLITGPQARYLSSQTAEKRKKLILGQIYDMYASTPTPSITSEMGTTPPTSTTTSAATGGAAVNESTPTDTTTAAEARSDAVEAATEAATDTDSAEESHDTYHPMHYFEQDWIKEQYSGGCYEGIFPPGLLTASNGSYKKGLGSLYFGSTETADNFYGYVEGAMQSGERAALEVLALL